MFAEHDWEELLSLTPPKPGYTGRWRSTGNAFVRFRLFSESVELLSACCGNLLRPGSEDENRHLSFCSSCGRGIGLLAVDESFCISWDDISLLLQEMFAPLALSWRLAIEIPTLVARLEAMRQQCFQTVELEQATHG